MNITIAFYKAEGQFMDKLIRWWTGSPYSHCELVIGGLSYGSSNRDGGVRSKYIEWDSHSWDFLEIPEQALGVRQDEAHDWFMKNMGRKYDWFGLLWFVVPINLQDPKKWFCAEAIAEALKLQDSWKYSPHTLYLALRQKAKDWAQRTPA